MPESHFRLWKHTTMQTNFIEEVSTQTPVIPQFDLDDKETTSAESLMQTEEYQSELDALRSNLSERLRQNSTYDDKGLLAYWSLVVPVAAISFLGLFLNGEVLLSLIPALLLAVGKKFYSLAEALDVSRASWQMNYLDRSQVGLLVELLHDRDKRIAGLAEMILTAILPHLTPEESNAIDGDQWQMLYNRLSMENARRQAPLLIAILKALERIGNAEALPYIEQIAHSNARSQNEQWVRESALICVPLLRRRIYDAAHTAGGRQSESVPVPAAAALQSSPATETIEEPKTEAQIRAAARVQSLLKTLEDERKTHQQPGMRQFFNRLAWFTIFPGALYLTIQMLQVRDWLFAAFFALLTAMSTQLHRLTLSPKQIDIATRLALTRDVQAIGPLAEMMEWPDAECRRIAELALVGLLPLVKANDTALLTNKQRGILYRCLKPAETRRHWQLQMALLEALEQIGDEAAVTNVEELANAVPRSGVQKKVKDRAVLCLPFLSEKAKQSRDSQMLLRGSAMPASAPEILLRPALETQEARPQELLRPGSSA